jgi:hypothetical protein
MLDLLKLFAETNSSPIKDSYDRIFIIGSNYSSGIEDIGFLSRD